MAYYNIFENRVLNKYELEFNDNCAKIFVYIVRFNNYQRNFCEFWDYLSDKEKNQARKYYNIQLSSKYVISHGILRCILSYYTKLSPIDIKFAYNQYGKPFLKNCNIKFNMSHSHDIVSYVVALNYKVGIDIELHNDRVEIQELCNMVFTPTENKFFTAINDNNLKLKFFYNLWTKKEALVKASGQGLLYPINTIESLTLSSGNSITLNNSYNKREKIWHCFPLTVARNYSGAVAVENEINQIIYLEMSNQKNVFDNIRLEYFN